MYIYVELVPVFLKKDFEGPRIPSEILNNFCVCMSASLQTVFFLFAWFYNDLFTPPQFYIKCSLSHSCAKELWCGCQMFFLPVERSKEIRPLQSRLGMLSISRQMCLTVKLMCSSVIRCELTTGYV